LSRTKLKIIIVMVLFFLFAGCLPTGPVAIATPNNSHSQISNSGSGIIPILLSLLLGNVYKEAQNIIPGLAEKMHFPAVVPSGTKEVLGFYAEWWNGDEAPYTSLTSNANDLTTIIPFWATLQADGSISDRGGQDHAGVVKFAHQHNISALLLVNNAKNTSSNSTINTVLAHPALRKVAIDNLENYLKQYKLNGINIDFEALSPGDKNNLTAFMRELSARLKPEGYVISIDVMPKTDESDDVSIAYDYANLCRYADKIILMTYDNHADWSGPGPIAAIDWVENNLKYALNFIPKQKLYLGVAAYGYDWSDKGVESLEYQSTVDLTNNFNIDPTWDELSKSPHFSYTDSKAIHHDVWYENSYSIKYKLDLVNKYDIAGIALWRLGDEDPGYWPLFSDKLHRN